MAKKQQHHKQIRALKAPTESIRTLKLLDQLQFELVSGELESALNTSEILINYLPTSSQHLPQVLLNRGTALLAMQDYDEAYNVLSKAAKLTPDDGLLLYMYAQACMFSMRSGKALVMIEKAIKADEILLREKSMKKTVNMIRALAKNSLRMRGKDFTLEQLIEQEELEHFGLQLMSEQKWEEAEAIFRQVIAMGDVLPQPHNNLASCLMMQNKFVEAEQELLISLKIEPRNTVAVNNLPVVRKAIKTGEIPGYGGAYNPISRRVLTP